MIGQLKGRMWVIFTRILSVETTIWSGFCKAQTMPHYISGEILQLIIRLSHEGCRQVEIARITGVTRGVINMIFKRARQTESPNQRLLGHRQSISTPQDDGYLLRRMRANRFLIRLTRPEPVYWHVVNISSVVGGEYTILDIRACILTRKCIPYASNQVA